MIRKQDCDWVMGTENDRGQHRCRCHRAVLGAEETKAENRGLFQMWQRKEGVRTT
jgi:hypothetical protein